MEINVKFTVMSDGEIYADVSTPKGDFLYTISQPSLDVAWGSIAEFIRDRVTTFVAEMAEAKDDPQCTRCGIYQSEHSGLAQDCDGFTTESNPFYVYTLDDLDDTSFFDW